MSDIATARIQKVLDKAEILECIHRTARGMDRHDAELIAAGYHSDAIDDHGYFSGPAAAFIENVNGSEGQAGVHELMFEEHMHFLGTHTSEIDGDTAHAETYYLMIGRYRGQPGTGIWAGRYIDRLERRNGEWKIALRRVTMTADADWPKPAAIGGDNLAGFPPVSWDRGDMSYQRPLTLR